MPFDKILDAVQANVVDAGLLIHEGQLLFRSSDCTAYWISGSGGTSAPSSLCRSG